MKVSIITVTFNCRKTILDTIRSVIKQDYPLIEYIIIDGASKDGTLDVVSQNRSKIQHFVSEPDKGIYDAMNKGLRLASGDIVGILNGDDIFFDSTVVSSVVEAFENKQVDAVCGNLVYVSSADVNKVVRYYNSENFTLDMFAYGHMPAHPTFFVKKKYYETYGFYKEDYKIAADFELLLRFLKIHKLSYSCIPKVLVKMRTGGVSSRSLKSNWVLNKEIIRACMENGINTNMAKILSKYFIKIFQLIQRPV